MNPVNKDDLETLHQPDRVIDYDKELDFARTFYERAVEGLEEEEYPPTPDEWMEGDVDKEFSGGWEYNKVALIGLIEAEDSNEKQVETAKAFLQCTLAVYLDLMSSISTMLLHSKSSTVESVEEMEEEVEVLE